MIQALLKSAYEDLTDGQLKQLTGFLSLIRQHEPIGATDFQASASKLLDDFYAAEPVLSGKPQDELVRPGGLPSATIGLVMHCPPSQNKSSNNFFDYQNPLLKLLMDKGITASNSYGFDWHWRSEPHERHRKCPARGYSIELRSIHEIMTYNLLEALPLPLLVISGSCPWKNYLKTLSSQARHIKVPIRPGVFCSFVLDFHPDRLRRISCHIPHPESIFYNKTLEWEYDSVDLALMIDCSLNLVLEFAGLSSPVKGSHFLDIVRKNPRYRPKRLATTNPVISPPSSNSTLPFPPPTSNKAQKRRSVHNGLTKSHAYVKQERGLGKYLTLDQYDQDFIDWALQIYGIKANDVLEEGESLALTIKYIMTDRVNATNNTRRQVERNIKAKAAVEVGDEENLPSPIEGDGSESNSDATSTMPAAKRQRRGPTHGAIGHELWHSKVIKVLAGGDISLRIPSENKSLKIRMGAKLDRKLKAKEMNNSVVVKNYTIEFAVDGIRIRYGTEVIWHKTISGLAHIGDGKRLLKQLDRELKAQGLERKVETLNSSLMTGESVSSTQLSTLQQPSDLLQEALTSLTPSSVMILRPLSPATAMRQTKQA
jgi:hypothetical protein